MSPMRMPAHVTRLLFALALSALVPAAVFAQSGKVASVHAKVTLYPDNTKSESVMDLAKHQITETTYDSQDVVIAKKVYLLDENGLAKQGVISDGSDRPIASVKFFYDELGRLIEQRLLNMQGEVFRRIIQSYDADGKALKPKAYNYNVKAPNMRPTTTDYTLNRPPPPAKKPEAKQDGAAAPASDGAIHIKPGQIINVQPKK